MCESAKNEESLAFWILSDAECASLFHHFAYDLPSALDFVVFLYCRQVVLAIVAT
jgi:hypothetical protein